MGDPSKIPARWILDWAQLGGRRDSPGSSNSSQARTSDAQQQQHLQWQQQAGGMLCPVSNQCPCLVNGQQQEPSSRPAVPSSASLGPFLPARRLRRRSMSRLDQVLMQQQFALVGVAACSPSLGLPPHGAAFLLLVLLSVHASHPTAVTRMPKHPRSKLLTYSQTHCVCQHTCEAHLL